MTTRIIGLAAILLFVVNAFAGIVFAEEAQQQYGFKDIPFGATYDEVHKKVEKDYGYGNLITPDITKRYLFMDYYELGSLVVEVTFLFDHDQKFYGFFFSTNSKTADKFEPEVIADTNHLNEIFKKKFGNPSQCYKPEFFSIKHGYVSYLCVWNHKDLDIFTGFKTFEARYSGVGYVKLKKMDKAYQDYLKKEKKESINEGVKQF